jgi:hypothetical protein
MSESEWQTLTTTGNQPEAELLKQRLEAEGIPVQLKPGDASAYLGASGPWTVQVPADVLERAKELLSA